jgi:hypothetical protein
MSVNEVQQQRGDLKTVINRKKSFSMRIKQQMQVDNKAVDDVYYIDKNLAILAYKELSK